MAKRNGALVPWILSVADGTGSRLVLHTSVIRQLESCSSVHEAGGSQGAREVSEHIGARRWLVPSNGFLTPKCATPTTADSRPMKCAVQAQSCLPPSEQIRLHCCCILRRPKNFLWHVRGICRAIFQEVSYCSSSIYIHRAARPCASSPGISAIARNTLAHLLCFLARR